MNVTVLFFANLKDQAGTSQITMEVSDHFSVADMREELSRLMPALAPALPTALVAVNQEFAFPDDLLPANAEVALFPPVSGGTVDEVQSGVTVFARVTGSAVDLEELVASITFSSTGAICLFTGIVRAQTVQHDSQQRTRYTDFLEYEAYTPMAEAKMRQVAEEIQEKWPNIKGIAMVQRVGQVYPGTMTVIIACSAGHRDTGIFEAARYGIDRLKEIVPVWKKECGPQGVQWIQGSYMPREHDR